MKFGPAPGRKRSGGPNRMEFSLVLGVFCLFLLSGGTGGTRSGSPARIDHFDLGRDMVKGGKMVAALPQGQRHGPFFVFCFESCISTPLHGARRAMALRAACSGIVK